MQAKMQDTHRDKLAKMATGDESAFRDLFSWASPKFVCSVGSREFCDMQVSYGSRRTVLVFSRGVWSEHRLSTSCQSSVDQVTRLFVAVHCMLQDGALRR